METSSPPRRRLSKEARQRQLLACAVEMAAESGLGRLVHADVARAAGVSVPTAFLYFPNREALLQAVVKEVSRFYFEQADSFHSGRRDPHAALLAHTRAYAASVDTHRDYALVWLEWSASARNECGLWDLFLEHNEALVRMISRTVRQAWGPGARKRAADDATRLLMGSVFAITQMKLVRQDERLVDRFLVHTVDMLLTRPAGN